MPRFPTHAASMHITHNQHKAYYSKIEDYILEDTSDDEFESRESKQRCIDADEIWEIQWYPDTPVGFLKVCGSTFEETLAFANKLDSEGQG